MSTLVKSDRTLRPTVPTFFDDMFMRDWFNWPFMNTHTNGGSVPAVNVRETNDSFELEVAAPGMSKQDFRVELQDDMLVISAEKEHKHEEQDNNGNYTRREFSYQSFRRTFSLPESMVQGDQISARYQDGVLHISVPKTEEARVKPAKQIQIS